jgi:hypothetical protein
LSEEEILSLGISFTKLKILGKLKTKWKKKKHLEQQEMDLEKVY